jgi:agmatine deiminase
MKAFFNLLYSLLFTLLISCSLLEDDYFLAADFDENELIYVVYVPNYSHIELIVTLSQHENVGVFVESEERIAGVKATLSQFNANQNNIRYEVFPGMDLWIRDSGPAILKNKNGKLKAVDFRNIVSKFEDNDQQFAKQLKLRVSDGKLVSVGGARESNGEGTVIVTEDFFASKLGKLNKAEVEETFRKHGGVRNVIWLKKGMVEDGLFANGPVYKNVYPVGCGGHVDEFCRFINPNTVLLAEVDSADLKKHPLYGVNHQRLEENRAILQQFTTHPLTVIRIPAAEFMYKLEENPGDGKKYEIMLTASYLNFVIGNHIILAAKYYEEGMSPSVKQKDEQVYAVLQAQFPNHKVLQINPKHLNARGGGYHCMTYNLPARKKRRIKLG